MRESVFDQIERLRAAKVPCAVDNPGPIFTDAANKPKTANKPKGRVKDAGAFWNDRTNSDPLKVRLDAAREARYPLWSSPKRHIRGSKVGDNCPRFMTIQAAGFEDPPKAKQSRIWDLGKAIEGVIIQNMKDAGIYVAEDVEIEYGVPRVKGHVDVVVELDGVTYLGEIKTINSNGFSRLPHETSKPVLAGESELMLTHSGYVEQLNTYLCAENAPSDKGFFLFECKDTCDWRVYWILADRRMMAGRLENAKEADEYIQAEEQMVGPIPAARDPFGADKVCAKCPAMTLCRKIPAEGEKIEIVRAIER